jgi:hypothetical protein
MEQQELVLEEESIYKVINIAGIKTFISLNKFEVSCQPLSETNDQMLVKMFRDWLKNRRDEYEM